MIMYKEYTKKQKVESIELCQRKRNNFLQVDNHNNIINITVNIVSQFIIIIMNKYLLFNMMYSS